MGCGESLFRLPFQHPLSHSDLNESALIMKKVDKHRENKKGTVTSKS